jgi:hypothetical protein
MLSDNVERIWASRRDFSKSTQRFGSGAAFVVKLRRNKGAIHGSLTYLQALLTSVKTMLSPT